MTRCRAARHQRRYGGGVLIVVLLWTALVAISTTASVELWSASVRARQLQAANAFGEEVIRAVASYYHTSPGTYKTLPADIESLLVDRRKLVIQRHLRRIPDARFFGQLRWKPIRVADLEQWTRPTLPDALGTDSRSLPNYAPVPRADEMQHVIGIYFFASERGSDPVREHQQGWRLSAAALESLRRASVTYIFGRPSPAASI